MTNHLENKSNLVLFGLQSKISSHEQSILPKQKRASSPAEVLVVLRLRNGAAIEFSKLTSFGIQNSKYWRLEHARVRRSSNQ